MYPFAVTCLVLFFVAMLTNLICGIITLVKIFKSDNGILHGIIGIFCGLWAFIYGWIKADEMDNKKIMVVWTIAFVTSIILRVLSIALLEASRRPIIY